MGIVKVWNDNIFPYKENFRGQSIEIPAKGYVKMAYDQAVLFRGTMPRNIMVDPNGHIRKESYKMIRIDMDPADVPTEADELVNHATGEKFASEDELEESVWDKEHMMADPEEAQKAKRKTTKKKASRKK